MHSETARVHTHLLVCDRPSAQLSVLACPHYPWGRLKWSYAITRWLGILVMSALVICKGKKEYGHIWHKMSLLRPVRLHGKVIFGIGCILVDLEPWWPFLKRPLTYMCPQSKPATMHRNSSLSLCADSLPRQDQDGPLSLYLVMKAYVNVHFKWHQSMIWKFIEVYIGPDSMETVYYYCMCESVHSAKI